MPGKVKKQHGIDLSKALDDELYERFHFQSHVAIRWIYDVHALRRQLVIGQDAHQYPGSQIFGEQHLGLHNDSHSVQRSRTQGLAVVDPEVAVDLHVVDDFAVGELPVLLSG